MAAYLSFAAVATVFAVKVLIAGDKRKSGIVSLITAWICGIIVGCMITVNTISDMNSKKSISVDVKSVSLTDDSEGEAAVVFTLVFHNGSKNRVTYLSTVYEEVTQNDSEIYHTPVNELLDEADEDIRIVCRSYDGKVVYVDSEFLTKDYGNNQ